MWPHVDRPRVGRASPHLEAGGLPESRWSPERRLPHCLDTRRLGPCLSLSMFDVCFCSWYVKVMGLVSWLLSPEAWSWLWAPVLTEDSVSCG